VVSPFDFLKSWEQGEMRSPRKQVMKRLAEMGEMPKEPKK
jgi:hypothetical protein